MQNKVLTSVLLVAVVAIWGYVGYRFLGGGVNEDEELENISFEKSSPQIASMKNITLKFDYEDPFLKFVTKPSQKAISIATNKRPVQLPKKEEVVVQNYVWPSIQFKGLIKNQNQPEKVLGLLIINGQERIVRIGETVNDLQVLLIKKDRVELQHLNEKKVYLK